MHAYNYVPRNLGICPCNLEIAQSISRLCKTHAQSQDRDLKIARAESVNFMSALSSSWLLLLAPLADSTGRIINTLRFERVSVCVSVCVTEV